MADTFHDNVKVTITGTPGTGAITWSAAVTDATNGDYLDPDASGAVDGESHALFLQEGNSTSVETGCVYTASTKTWARGTVLVSSTGSQLSLTSAAKVSIVAASMAIANTAEVDALLFGDGSDGDVTISGAVTLSRDMFYRNLTVSTGAALNPAGYRIFVSQTLNLINAPAAAITLNGTTGTDASGATGGGSPAIVVAANLGVPLPPSGNAGSNGTGSAGSNGAGSNVTSIGGSGPTQSGAGGAGSGRAGGSGATLSITAFAVRALTELLGISSSNLRASAAGPKGGAGGGDSTNAGGGSGSGGAGAGCIIIFARTITRAGTTAVAAIQCIGGSGSKGGTPPTGNCGGGGGGGAASGGFVLLAYRYLTGSSATSCIDVSGGAGGAGGNGVGTGGGGAGGYSGTGGVFQQLNVATDTVSVNTSSTQNAGTAASGGTGGAGGAQVVTRYDL